MDGWWLTPIPSCGRAYRGLIGEFVLLRNSGVAIFVSPQDCFILVYISDIYVSKIMHL